MMMDRVTKEMEKSMQCKYNKFIIVQPFDAVLTVIAQR
jgi:hypothetical protein